MKLQRITVPHKRLLRELTASGPLTTLEASHRLGQPRSSTARCLCQLRDVGLVCVSYTLPARGPSGRRRQVWGLTESAPSPGPEAYAPLKHDSASAACDCSACLIGRP